MEQIKKDIEAVIQKTREREKDKLAVAKRKLMVATANRLANIQIDDVGKRVYYFDDTEIQLLELRKKLRNIAKSIHKYSRYPYLNDTAKKVFLDTISLRERIYYLLMPLQDYKEPIDYRYYKKY